MAAGNMKATQRRCGQCGKATKHERNAMVMGCGDVVMVLLTLGLWLPLRLMLNAMSNPWRCSECGAG